MAIRNFAAPWREVCDDGEWFVEDADGSTVCKMLYKDADSVNRGAVIIAAPDLLAASEAIDDYFSNMASASAPMRKLLVSLRAAIAKARGEV